MLVVLAGALLAVAPAAATADVGPTRPASGVGTVDDVPPGGTTAAAPVVLIGTAGLRWEDVDALATPGLWWMSRHAALGTVAARSVRGVACPADGWLAVNAGTRLADLEVPDGTCRTLRDPWVGEPVPGWADYQEAAATQPYAARPGLLGDLLAEADVAATGIGPGAAIALADADGRPVGDHVARPGRPEELRRAVQDALTEARLVVVDVGAVRDAGSATRGRLDGGDDQEDVEAEDPGLLPRDESDRPEGVDAIVEPSRLEQVREIDGRVDAVLDATTGTGATVLLVSLADSGRVALQLAAALGPAPHGGGYGEGLLTSGTTRQTGLLQSTDVTATLLAALDETEIPDAAIGAPIVPTDGPASPTQRVAALVDIGVEARQVTRVSGAFLTRLVLAQAVLFVAAGVLLTRRGADQRPGLRRGLRLFQAAALALGSVPIAGFLADTVPWWRAGDPITAFWLAVLAWVAVITAVALAGPWRRYVLGPAAVVSGITVATLLVDPVLGSPLVIDSPMGAHRLMAARFYGMSNQAFALLTAAGLVFATAIAQPLVDRGRRRLATGLVIALGLVIAVVDGAPGLGSDFGGPPAIILAFTVLATVVSGRRVQWRILLVVAVAGAVVVTGFAWLDWLRPAGDRTHLGRFFATVLDGGLWDVLARKVSVHLRVITLWRYLLLAVGGALVTALVLRGSRHRGGGAGSLAGLRDAVPLVGACVAAVGLGLGIGFLINDSGIVIVATGVAVAVPCLLAAAAQRRLQDAPVS